MNEPAIRALIAKWRKKADAINASQRARRIQGDPIGSAIEQEARACYRECADELEVLLAASGEADETPTGKIPKGMPD